MKESNNAMQLDYPAHEETSSPELKKDPAKIMIIDEHTVLREGLCALLKDFNQVETVAQCSESDQALEMISTTNPELILVDATTTNSSAYEFVKTVHANNASIKIIFFASGLSDRQLERALKIGVSGFISKLEPLSGILAAISQVMQGHKYFSQDIQKRLISQKAYDPKDDCYMTRRVLLSPREIEVLCCVAKGMKAKVIGKNLHITAKTVERHKSNIMAKLGLHSQVDLAIYAFREGYVEA